VRPPLLEKKTATKKAAQVYVEDAPSYETGARTAKQQDSVGHIDLGQKTH